jgi:hypothetical protein
MTNNNKRNNKNQEFVCQNPNGERERERERERHRKNGYVRGFIKEERGVALDGGVVILKFTPYDYLVKGIVNCG